ncbi:MULTISPECIES: bifunctional diaminohydroxyphosphoribosylaminopyrimidine deaminase/5-amino-6-(5-phosphoribosylamino)uracil reductase RibD [unclassified Bradyrhizobium]|uniref:bifunctional diaminohydroxyphosphoribosylaminopyrimidine deaminase/5-amino-6-(5-phosphoribosylamino)uracil reductase RibD n=1 Tax=unclassified Bradyrhizobium TaxID=2631580 RepID=UPI0028E66A04|nr:MULTISPECIES: bifunctional diaminohydroxyphosphoribosylaminopyrimidine deaminase/5-amino-6-(5-phosphoribosylamino)uracil reductase RibD [unclassified Bradyrhizobium]
MQLSLALGRLGLGRTWPNPSVGALVVKNGAIVGCGSTQPGGRPHAEPVALKQAGEAARGATLYVTLEPCSHFGTSPPCTDAIIGAGISRVVAAIEDPNPVVAGQGFAKLRAAGITVVTGINLHEAAYCHAGHFRRIRDHRPHVILKLALSSDHKIGASGGTPVVISGPSARDRIHLLRAQTDAILVGIGTVLADDPLLTCRLPGMESCSPVRVVLDSNGCIPDRSRLVTSAQQTPLWVFTSDRSNIDTSNLQAAGATIFTVRAASGSGLDLLAVLHVLADKGITRVLVEGGSRVASSFVAANLVDEAWLLHGKRAIGGNGIDALAELPLEQITCSRNFQIRHRESLDADLLTIYENTQRLL